MAVYGCVTPRARVSQVMWHAQILLPNGAGSLPLYVQDTNATNPQVVEFDARMSRSQFLSQLTTLDDVARLFDNVHGHRLWLLDERMPVVEVQCTGQQPTPTLGAIELRQMDAVDSDGWALFTNPQPTTVHMRAWARKTTVTGQWAVWRVRCSVYMSRLTAPITRIMRTLRASHLFHASVTPVGCDACGGSAKPEPKGELVAEVYDDRHRCKEGFLERWRRRLLGDPTSCPLHNKQEPAPTSDKPVESCLEWAMPTFQAALPSDRACMRALSRSYAVDAGHSLAHTDIGSALISSSVSPQTSLMHASDMFIQSAVDYGLADHGGYSPAYLEAADTFDERVRLAVQAAEPVEGWLRDMWTGMVDGIPESLKKFLPKKENVDIFNEADVSVAPTRALDPELEALLGGGGAPPPSKPAATTQVDYDRLAAGAAGAAKGAGQALKKLDSSDTAKALVQALVRDKSDVPYVEALGRALANDLGVAKDGVASQLIVKGAPKLKTALGAAAGKLRTMKASDFSAYTDALRKMVNNADMAKLGSVLARAGDFVSKNTGTLVSAGKTAASAVSSATPAITSAAKTAASAVSSATPAITSAAKAAVSGVTKLL